MVVCRGDEFLQYLGYKKESPVKNYLYFDNRILNINQQNKYGESLIFVASYFCEFEMVIHLLTIGADPNIQNNEGNTALHAAAYFDNLKLLQILVESGGDLRLVNNDGLRPCQMMKNVKNSQKIKNFEQNLFSHFKNQLSLKNNPISIPHRKNSILHNFPKLNLNYQPKFISPYFTFQSGFGNYVCLNKTIKGVISSVKIIVNSKNLTTDMKSKISSFPCGLYTKIISKYWNNTPVSVKVINLLEGKENVSDRRTNILTNNFIKEVNILGSMRHPNIILLMCVNIILDEIGCTVQYQPIFERCESGSMYNFLHNQKLEFDYDNRISILNNITEALFYIHSQGFVHGAISSHCIYLINDQVAKLGNFENVMEISNFEEKRSYLNSQHWNSYNFYNNFDNRFKWIAPEMLRDKFVINSSIDLYSFGIIIWESFIGIMPHQLKTYKSLIQRYCTPYSNEFSTQIPEHLLILLQQCVKQDPAQRPQLRTIKTALLNLNSLKTTVNGFNKSINADIEHESIIKLARTVPEIETKNEKLEHFALNKEIVINTTDDNSTYTTISSNKPFLKRSNSFDCLIKNDIKGKSKFLENVTKNISSEKFDYRNMAALPNFDNSELNWKFPSSQTEVIIEGQGSLSNSTHKISITRGMKPASHQTSLSTSQTNICTLIGTKDLIKSSSRGSLQKNHSSSSLNKIHIENKTNKTVNPFSDKQLYFSTFTNPKLFRPNIKSNIANLIRKYENSEFHPYSSSNNSTPKVTYDRNMTNYNSPSKFIFNKSNSSEDSIKTTAISTSSSSTISTKKRAFFPPITKRDNNEWSSTTEEEDIKVVKKFNVNSRFNKSKLFGDLTNIQ